MLQVVSIKQSDIVTASPLVEFSDTALTGSNACSADRFRDDFDTGY